MRTERRSYEFYDEADYSNKGCAKEADFYREPKLGPSGFCCQA
jgi:hypothetical protein